MNTQKNNPVKVLKMLKTELPICFKKGKDKLPLAIGIHNEVIKHYAKDTRFEAEVLKTAIGFYTHGSKYLQRLACGMPRINLNGASVSVVSLKEQYYAQKILNARRKVTKRNNIEQTEE